MNTGLVNIFSKQFLEGPIVLPNKYLNSTFSVDYTFKPVSSTNSSTLRTESTSDEGGGNDSTFIRTEPVTSTRQIIDVQDSYSAIRTIVAYKVDKEGRRRENLVLQLVKELEEALSLFTIDNDEHFFAEEKIIEIERKFSFDILGEVIQKVCIRHFDKPKYLTGICEALLRYDLEEVSPWAPIMLPGLLNHVDESVKEHAVLLIDNWNDAGLLPMLLSLEIKSDWLQDYVNGVIKELQSEDVLRKKAI